jgi:MoaA/NifB/PqqE/SkfB family radical SAM enzyme
MKKLYLLKQGFRASRKLLLVELARHSKSLFPAITFDPMVATLIVTDNCNSRCITCTEWRQKSSNELTLDEISSVLTQLKQLGVRGISITGGEPLLRKDVTDIVRKCSTLRFEDIQILTNGLLLTPDLAEELLESGVTTMGISLDGLKETNDSVRGIEGSFEKVISALKMVGELRDKKYHSTELYVATTLMKPTLNQIIPLANLVRDLKVKINLNLIDNSPYFLQTDISDFLIEDQNELDRVVDELHELKRKHGNIFLISQTHASIEYLRKYFQDPKREDIPCILGHVCIYIGAHGELYSGCLALKPLGNVREQSLKEIVNSAEYKERLYDMFYKKCPGCSSHHNMNLLYYAPWIKDELLWKLRMKKRHVL